MSLRIALSYAIRCKATSNYSIKTQARKLSNQGGQAVQKLRGVLEEYRLENYTQELPSRFKKEVILAAKKEESDCIVSEGMLRVLHNIGYADRFTPEEMQIIFDEIGGNSGEIPINRMMHIISTHI